jgi:hypothetical protein
VGKLIDIPPDIIQAASDGFDDLIDYFGKPCKMIYASAQQTCPNCIVNPETGDSTNKYNGTGPEPFPDGQICPICEGKGKITAGGGYDIIQMSLDWNPRTWFEAPWIHLTQGDTGAGPSPLRVSGAAVQSKGYMTDLPKVLAAESAILDINDQYFTNNFTLLGEPWSPGSIVKERYFYALWQKAK